MNLQRVKQGSYRLSSISLSLGIGHNFEAESQDRAIAIAREIFNLCDQYLQAQTAIDDGFSESLAALGVER